MMKMTHSQSEVMSSYLDWYRLDEIVAWSRRSLRSLRQSESLKYIISYPKHQINPRRIKETKDRTPIHQSINYGQLSSSSFH